MPPLRVSSQRRSSHLGIAGQLVSIVPGIAGALDEAQSVRVDRETELTLALGGRSRGELPDDDGFSDGGQAPPSPLAIAALDHDEWQVAAPWTLKVCGILGWEGTAGRLYKAAVLVMVGALAVAFLITLIFEHVSGHEVSFYMMFDLAIAVGSFLGLIATTPLQHFRILGTSDSMLVQYARQQGVIAAWASSRRWQSAGLVTAWAATALLRILSAQRSGEIGTCTLPCGIFLCARSLSTGIFLSVMGAMLHVCSGLALFIDSFCSSLASEWDVEGSVIAWNLLQAVLRRASSFIAACFLIIQTTTLSVVLFAISGHVHNDLGWEWLMAVSVLMLCNAHLLFKAGQVTDKCSRVPPLVNSLDFSDCATLDKKRLYLVEYVTYSAAGFYVGETRLTSSMALKLAYISIICAFGLFSRGVNESEQG